MRIASSTRIADSKRRQLALIIVFSSLSGMIPAATAQEFNADGIDINTQIDITNGMEKNAALQGHLLQQQMAPQQIMPHHMMNAPMQPMPPQQAYMPMQNGYGLHCGQAMMPMPNQAAAGFCQTQNAIPQNQQANCFAQSQMPPASSQSAPQAPAAPQSSPGISGLLSGMQVAGALGTALMLNYAVKGGGIRNQLNRMPGGWNNRRHTFGSRI